jgi:hypothetical protein
MAHGGKYQMKPIFWSSLSEESRVLGYSLWITYCRHSKHAKRTVIWLLCSLKSVDIADNDCLNWVNSRTWKGWTELYVRTVKREAYCWALIITKLFVPWPIQVTNGGLLWTQKRHDGSSKDGVHCPSTRRTSKCNNISKCHRDNMLNEAKPWTIVTL